MAYGKVFDTFFGSSIMDEDVHTRYVFLALITLSDRDGVIDINRSSLARQLNVPRKTLNKAIERLEAPDPESRNPEFEGRRIIRLDDHRDWGWKVVSKEHYREAKDDDELREQARIRKQRQRERERQNQDQSPETPENKPSGHGGVTPRHAESHDVTAGHAPSRHTDTDTDANTDKNPPYSPPKGDVRFQKSKAFDEVWRDILASKIPKPTGKPRAKRRFDSSVKTEKDVQAVYEALRRYRGSDRVRNGYVMDASRWFGEWEDWAIYDERPARAPRYDEAVPEVPEL